jgi:hypothetical protein
VLTSRFGHAVFLLLLDARRGLGRQLRQLDRKRLTRPDALGHSDRVRNAPPLDGEFHAWRAAIGHHNLYGLHPARRMSRHCLFLQCWQLDRQ